jgi:hypothetical protein
MRGYRAGLLLHVELVMTEDEAKTKWCPFARVASPSAITPKGSLVEQWIGVAGANRGALSDRVVVHTDGDASNPASARCIGSACMAWRKVPGASKFKDARTGQLSDRDLTGHGTWVYEGFCGLAGAPQ